MRMTLLRTTQDLTLTACVAGFGTSVVMWMVGFITHLPGLRVPAAATAGFLVLVQLMGGVYAGRRLPSGGWVAGAAAGTVAGLLNLLIVGSVIAADHDSGGGLRPGWGGIVLGTILFGFGVGAVGGAIGGRLHRPGPAAVDPMRNLASFGVVTAAAALPVLLSGGIVTSTNAGLAVPDWPTSYGANMFLFPLSKMTGGIYYEHSHRLFGSLAGLTTLALAILILACERRAWMKALGVLAFLLVVGQGVLGGIGVTSATVVSDTPSPEALVDNASSRGMRMVHGMTGQVFFAYLCVLAAMLSPSWRRPADACDRRLTLFAVLLVAGLIVQLGLGTTARHMQHGHAVMSHVGFALIVVVLAALAGFRAASKHRDHPTLRRLGHGVLHTTGLQVVLGVLTFLLVLPYEDGKVDPPITVITATAHQAVGAVLLGLSAMLAAWSLRRPAAE